MATKKERREARKAAIAEQAEAYEKNEKMHDALEGDEEVPVKKTKNVERVELEGKVTVTRSYSRKLNMSIHGGAQYETLDLGETRSIEVDATEANAASTQLYYDCKESVEESIRQFDNEMELFGKEAEVNHKEEKAPKKTAKDDIGVDREELKEIAEVLNRLVAVDNAEDLETFGDEIAAMKDLSKSQLDYLRKMYNKKAKDFANVD